MGEKCRRSSHSGSLSSEPSNRASQEVPAGVPHKLSWLGTNSGEYTTKSGYHPAIKLRTEIEEHTEDVGEVEWFKFIWNLQTSAKIKIFLWKVFHKAIPVGEVLAARHITFDARDAEPRNL